MKKTYFDSKKEIMAVVSANAESQEIVRYYARMKKGELLNAFASKRDDRMPTEASIKANILTAYALKTAKAKAHANKIRLKHHVESDGADIALACCVREAWFPRDYAGTVVEYGAKSLTAGWSWRWGDKYSSRCPWRHKLYTLNLSIPKTYYGHDFDFDIIDGVKVLWDTAIDGKEVRAWKVTGVGTALKLEPCTIDASRLPKREIA